MKFRPIFILTLAFLFTQCKVVENVAIKSRKEAKLTGLTSTYSAVSNPTFPKNWDASLFLSKQTINNSLNGLTGTIVTNKEEGTFLNWYCIIDTISLEPEPGALNSVIQFSVFSPNGKYRGKLNLGTLITVSQATHNLKEDQLDLRLDHLPIEIDIEIKLGDLSFKTEAKKSKLIADFAVVFAKSKLHSIISIKDKIESNFAFVNPTTEKVYYNEEDKSQGYVTMRIASENQIIRKYLKFDSPAFLSNGVWMNFSISNEREISTDASIKSDLNKKELDGEITRLENSLIALDSNPDINPTGTTFWMNKRLFEGVFDTYNNLPLEVRTIYINSIDETGHMAKEVWGEDEFLRGGYYAELAHDKAIQGTIKLGKIDYNWSPINGLAFETKIDGELKTDIHVHLDPYVGGGFGGQINLLGSTSPTIKGTFGINPEKIGKYNVLLLKPDISCSAVKFDLGSNNDKFGAFGKLTSIGVTQESLIGDQYINPICAFSDIPMFVNLETPSDTTSSKIEFPHRYMLTKLSVDKLVIDAEGLTISVIDTISFTSEDEIIDSILNSQNELERLLTQYYEGAHQKKCPRPDPLEAYLGPFKFGENNDIIKFLAKVDADMESLKGNAKQEWEKFKLNPGKAIVDMPENIQKASKKAIKDAEKEAERTYAKLKKAKESIDKEATKGKKNVDRELTKGKKKVDNGLTKARKKLLGDKKVKIKIKL